MPNLFRLRILLSGALLAGCAGPFQYKPRTLSQAHWEASQVSVVIDDRRTAVSTELPRVPTITMGGGQEASLRLPPQFSEFVQWRLAQLITRRGSPVRLVVVPESVRAGWHASAFAETETAAVTLRFRVTTQDGSRVLFEAVGKAQQEFSSADASDEELGQVFRAACNDAFDSVFASAINVQHLNESGCLSCPVRRLRRPRNSSGRCSSA